MGCDKVVVVPVLTTVVVSVLATVVVFATTT